LYRDQGVVLRTIKLGETDRIVTIMSQGHGKIRAVAKGVRKPGSRFGARLEPMTHLAFQCYRGRSDLDIVNQVETIDANRALREHYGCLTHAVSMLEATDQVAQDREPNPALYRMLVRALLTLAADPSPLVSTAFFWKLLSLEGYHPMLDECVRCGAGPDDGVDDTEFVAFDLDEGGILCADCGRFAGKRISPEALVQLRRILGGELRAALAEPVGPVTVETERLALSSLEHHLERKLRSAALL
jgi:DNA repair protein RecO (recombination protein O)